MIQDRWREWLEDLASFYRVSSLKMFKTAFPPGWIGKHKKLSQNFKYQIWIESQIDFEFSNSTKFLSLGIFLVKKYQVIKNMPPTVTIHVYYKTTINYNIR